MSDTTPNKLSIVRCTLTGAAVLVIQFAICWASAAAGFAGGSHMYISIFTLEPVGSLDALAIGSCWSVVFGGLTGALIAITYNAFGFVQGRTSPASRTAQA
jgi:hypothetical protein